MACALGKCCTAEASVLRGFARSTMTLVDLPGIAKVAVGDQPSDIEARIRRMALEYIRHPTCVILAVSAANADLVNSDALELARAADPDGRRTVGEVSVARQRVGVMQPRCAAVPELLRAANAAVRQAC